MRFCTAMFLKVERRRHLDQSSYNTAAVQERGASHLLKLTSSSTREKYMSGCWRRASMNGSGKEETQTSFKSVSWRVGRNQQTRARLQSKVLAQRHRQQRRTHSKQQVAALVGTSVADAGHGQHGAHSKQLLARARRELRAARIALDAPLLRRKAHSCAHGTIDAERGAGRRCVFEFAERQVLDVHGSVLDARKQRLQLLSARADVGVERQLRNGGATATPRARESNSTAPPSSKIRSDSNVAADDAARIGERRNA